MPAAVLSMAGHLCALMEPVPLHSPHAPLPRLPLPLQVGQVTTSVPFSALAGIIRCRAVPFLSPLLGLLPGILPPLGRFSGAMLSSSL